VTLEEQRQWGDDFIAAGQALAERTPEEWEAFRAGKATSVRVVHDGTVHVQRLRDIPMRAGDTLCIVEMEDGVMRLKVTSPPPEPCTDPADGPVETWVESVPADSPLREFAPYTMRMRSVRYCSGDARRERCA
jgi:hypothetical protein